MGQTPHDKPQKPRKIAILGFAGASLDEAPVHDETWEIWGLNELWRTIPRWQRWFDLHPVLSLQNRPGHLAWMQQQPADKLIYLQEMLPEIPASRRYPKEEITRLFGPYFTSSIAWMLGMAISERPAVIGIWGVDMLHDTEYEYQRPCCDYYVGYARGLGIAVYVPETSALGKAQALYGYENFQAIRDRSMQKRFKKRKEQIIAAKDSGLQALYNCDGALSTIEQFATNQDIAKRIMIRFEQEGQMLPDGSLDVLNDVVGTYCNDVGKLISEKREEAMQKTYAMDGALSELAYCQDIVSHIRRGGV